ncbi:hypothetical protein [Roseobacter sp. HKCCA0434]|nr:hypothetical protein [Roseobacter sp. HKCCA0434]
MPLILQIFLGAAIGFVLGIGLVYAAHPFTQRVWRLRFRAIVRSVRGGSG